MDEIKPTPRNKLLGLLADNLRSGLDFATNEGKNKPMNLLAEVLGLPAIQTTADRLSYGEPLTTGQGWTTRLKPDTFDAAISALPFVKPATKGAGLLAEGLMGLEGSKAVQSLSKASPMSDRGAIVWQDIPKRGTREEFKNAVQNNAENFANELRLKGYYPEVTHSGSKAGSSSYVKIPGFDEFRISDHSKGAFNSQFYNHILDNKIADDFLSKIQQAPESTVFENPRSLLDLTASEARPAVFEANKNARDSNAAFSKAFSNSGKYLGNERLLKILERNGESAAPAFNYPQSEALKLAQQRAALPVSEGGLGLPANNTAMDRANVMGFEDGWVHGSPMNDIDVLKSSNIGAEGRGAYATNYLPESAVYAGEKSGATSYPLMVDMSKSLNTDFGANVYSKLNAINDAELAQNLSKLDKNSITATQPKTPKWMLDMGLPDMPIREHFVSEFPDVFRSRFAAFDPWRRNAAIAASMGVAAPDLLANPLNDENNRLIDILRKK